MLGAKNQKNFTNHSRVVFPLQEDVDLEVGESAAAQLLLPAIVKQGWMCLQPRFRGT